MGFNLSNWELLKQAIVEALPNRPAAEGSRPEQVEVSPRVRFASIRVEADGTRAAVRFSDGTEVIVSAEELYAQSGR
jgi:hypothetical protein